MGIGHLAANTKSLLVVWTSTHSELMAHLASLCLPQQQSDGARAEAGRCTASAGPAGLISV